VTDYVPKFKALDLLIEHYEIDGEQRRPV